MTNEEAIELIESARKTMYLPKSKEYISDFGYALDMAIKALEQQTCENINEDYADCDLFVCSECGIELQDWDRIERDDDGEISYHEYTFRYCPNCGRRIKYDE